MEPEEETTSKILKPNSYIIDCKVILGEGFFTLFATTYFWVFRRFWRKNVLNHPCHPHHPGPCHLGQLPATPSRDSLPPRPAPHPPVPPDVAGRPAPVLGAPARDARDARPPASLAVKDGGYQARGYRVFSWAKMARIHGGMRMVVMLQKTSPQALSK